MYRYIYKRLIGLIPLFFVVTFFAFVLINFRTSDPAEIVLRVNGVMPTEEMVENMRLTLGLDQPFLVRYGNWITSYAQGDFGNSFVNGNPVGQEFHRAFPPTLYLAGVTLLIVIVASISLGVLCALYENRLADKMIRGFIFLASAMPSFWIGLLFVWFFAVQLGWFPTSGMRQPSSVVLPALTLSLAFLSTYVRLIRNNMIQMKSANFILYAKVRGLSRSAITRQMFLNSIHSSLTAFGMSIPRLIAGTVVVENVFAWPGLGRLGVSAILNSDFPVIQAYIMMMAVLFIICNFLVDIVTMAMDPRLRRAV